MQPDPAAASVVPPAAGCADRTATDDVIDLDAIMQRHEKARFASNTGVICDSADDVPALLAEVRRLHAEIAILTAERDGWSDMAAMAAEHDAKMRAALAAVEAARDQAQTQLAAGEWQYGLIGASGEFVPYPNRDAATVMHAMHPSRPLARRRVGPVSSIDETEQP